jgi:pimeloyl-ACP methyl ester carboxylesterase
MDISARSGRHLSSRDAIGATGGVALVLHGGRVTSREPVNARQLAVVRVALLAGALHRRVAEHGIAVWNLRFGVRGWNGAEASPVADVFWALEQIRLHAGLPVVLVGHSMGGRAALRAAGDPSVRGVVALAPWLPEGEPIRQLADRSLVILHGDADRITDPEASARYAESVRPVARSVRLERITGDGHGMLRRAGTWNRLAAQGVRDILGEPAPRIPKHLDEKSTKSTDGKTMDADRTRRRVEGPDR